MARCVPWRILALLISLLILSDTGRISQPSSYKPFVVQGVTKIVSPDHEDPDYTDVCYEITREVCDFCCLVDFEFCSRDIGICEPVTDRHLILILHCVFALGIVLCGIPLVVAFVKCFILFRFLEGVYKNTAGVSCYELLMRMTCILCCIRFDEIYPPSEDAEEEEEQRGPIFKFFYYTFCCFLCPGLFKKKAQDPVGDDDEGEGEGEEGEGDEEGEEGEEGAEEGAEEGEEGAGGEGEEGAGGEEEKGEDEGQE